MTYEHNLGCKSNGAPAPGSGMRVVYVTAVTSANSVGTSCLGKQLLKPLIFVKSFQYLPYNKSSKWSVAFHLTPGCAFLEISFNPVYRLRTERSRPCVNKKLN